MTAEGHAVYHANRAVWGNDRPAEFYFLRHPDGPGWHLDRARFDRWLRDRAVARGASLVVGLAIDGIARHDGRWRVELSITRAATSLPPISSSMPADEHRPSPLPLACDGRTMTMTAWPAVGFIEIAQAALAPASLLSRPRPTAGGIPHRCRVTAACWRSTPTAICRQRVSPPTMPGCPSMHVRPHGKSRRCSRTALTRQSLQTATLRRTDPPCASIRGRMAGRR